MSASPKLDATTVPVSRSHGRGGAGNINSNPPAALDPASLQTPTIKQTTYTTGRGGQGNMASNNNPEHARAAQDVEAPKAHEREIKGTYHWGRGGEGNMMTVKGNSDSTGSSAERPGPKARQGSFRGAVEKGRELLGLKKEGAAAKSNESAVE